MYGRSIGSRISYSNVVATLALFIALGGGAYALSLPKNSVKARQIAKNAVRGAEAKEQTFSIVPNADALDGLDSSAFLRGDSTAFLPSDAPVVRYDEPIPSGRTVIGGWDVWEDSATNAATRVVSLPADAGVELTDECVNFNPGPTQVDDDPSCAGSVAEPTAPPGRVCLYVNPGAIAAVLAGQAAVATGTARRHTFAIATAANGDGIASGTWAYTAP